MATKTTTVTATMGTTTTTTKKNTNSLRTRMTSGNQVYSPLILTLDSLYLYLFSSFSLVNRNFGVCVSAQTQKNERRTRLVDVSLLSE